MYDILCGKITKQNSQIGKLQMTSVAAEEVGCLSLFFSYDTVWICLKLADSAKKLNICLDCVFSVLY